MNPVIAKRGLLSIMAVLLVQSVAWAQPAADTALLDMREAFRRNNAPTLTALLPRVRGHQLEPMARYWEARARLDTASPAEMREALDSMAGTYWEDRLRNDWLLRLGQQRDWPTFEAELPRFRMNDDRQVQCYALMLNAVAKRQPADALGRQVAELWLAQREADEGCATAAKAFVDSGHLGTEWVWRRARLAMETGRTRAVTQAVAMVDADALPMVNAIAANPARYLDEKITAIRPRTKELVTLAIIKLADANPEAAAQELDRTRWKAQLTQEERSWLWGVIGKRAAQKLQDNALVYFANGQDRFMHSDHLAWKVRAGLRAGAWGHVREAIGAMGEAQRAEPAWVYWQARALLALKQPDTATATAQARALYESIASPRGFYEQLALEELGRAITVPPPPPPLTAQEVDAARNNPGLQRALAAVALGLRSEGVREWNYTTNLHDAGGMGERELLAAAALACEQALWDRCINSSERTRLMQDYSQRFPMPHQSAVVQRASAIGLDPAYVFGLIRQESRFVTDARSGVGASGLMQVMPATARWTARKIGMTDFQPQRLSERDTNIAIGTAYLKLALDDFEGSMPMAAAAYNAGPNRPRAWRNGPVLAGEIWAENIPFEETRDYVKKVLANTTTYAAIITGQPQSLRARLGMVGPRSTPTPINTELP
ncbi:MAG: transglycosylase SLT domain-containing protein [Hydrogenophaga sp.]|uniref:lytic transglycosylase domain-containing protein n=1 Tax=Hydrogenophaga sp. TaxID=1904254 RepID=UPI003D9BB610